MAIELDDTLANHLRRAINVWHKDHPKTIPMDVLRALEQIRYQITEKMIAQRRADGARKKQ